MPGTGRVRILSRQAAILGLTGGRCGISGASAFVAKSTHRDFSPATGIEGLAQFGPKRDGNAPGARYSGHDWIFRKPDGTFIIPFEYPGRGFFTRRPTGTNQAYHDFFRLAMINEEKPFGRGRQPPRAAE